MQTDLLRDLHPDETLSRLERVWPYPEIGPAPPRPIPIRRPVANAEENRARVLKAVTQEWKRTRAIAKAAKLTVDTAAYHLDVLSQSRLVERTIQPAQGNDVALWRRTRTV